MIIHHSKPTIDEEDIRAVGKVLSSGNISQGEKVKEFEKEYAEYIGVKHSIAVSSGTSAIHLALISLNIKQGDEVILPSYVCSSPYMAILYLRANPRIVDVSPSDFNIDVNSIKKAITPSTKAIIVPHIFGFPAELDEILDLGIPVIEDCAHSIGAEYKKKKVGSLGTLSICSFYATKMMTTGEGGMVATKDDDLCDTIMETREYDKRPLNRERYNYKMTDFQAALGISQLQKLNAFIERRRSIAEFYSEAFSDLPITLPLVKPHVSSVFYRYVVITSRLNWTRKIAKERGLLCEKPVWKPLHQNLANIKCPNTDFVHDHALSIPLYPSLKEEEIDYMTKTFKSLFAK